MTLARCFVCERPVLEMTGQFAVCAPHQLREEDEDVRTDGAFGHCHLSCLTGSKWGPLWATRYVDHLRRVLQVRPGERGDLTMFEAKERTVVRADGMRWGYPVERGQQAERGALFALDEEWNVELEDQALVDRIRAELQKEGRSALIALAEALGVRDRLLEVERLGDAHLAFDRELASYWEGAWISARARYSQFVPEHILGAGA